MKIGLDIDGVLADFIGAFRNEASWVLGRRITGEPANWDFSNWMTAEEQNKVWVRVRSTDNWFEKYPRPMPGVWENLYNLTAKHEVYFISARDNTAGDPVQVQTQHWLRGLKIEFPTVIITKTKGPIVAALKLDVFLDDKTQNLEDIQLSSPGTKLFLQNASHNQKDKIGIRIVNFKEFMQYEQSSFGL